LTCEKDIYEKTILDTQLFSISKETSPNLYDREKNRLISNLYGYLMTINKKKYEPYGSEIVEVAVNCIRSFSSEKGEFLHYFNVAWKNEYKRICSDEIFDKKFCGMTKITSEEKRAIIGLIKYREKKLSEKGTEINNEDILQEYSDLTGIAIEKIKYVAQMETTHIIDGSIIDENGEEKNIIEQIPDTDCTEDFFEEADNLYELMAKIEKAFEKLQERQKTIISDLITSKICHLIADIWHDEYPSFISIEIMDLYISTGQILTQRDIAQKYNKLEASVSRTYKDFISKILV
jgi:hypothetical protein